MLTGKVAGIFALITTALGLISSPAVMNLIPPHYAALIIAIGAGWAAFTDALHKSSPDTSK
jgi:hypothetical protein